jgi:hypothetical protein
MTQSLTIIQGAVFSTTPCRAKLAGIEPLEGSGEKSQA